MFSQSTYSQLDFLPDDFDYPAGDALVSHGWNYSGPIVPSNYYTKTISPGLIFSRYGLGVGNAAFLDSLPHGISKWI